MSNPELLNTTLLLIRHAESEANSGGYFGSQSDSVLTPRGREQAERLAASLNDLEVHAVYSSDLSRARDTVAPLAGLRNLDVNTDPLLRERDMGDLTGMSFADAEARYPELWSRWSQRDLHARPPGGESYIDLCARIAPVIEAIVARHAKQTVIIGSHGGTLNAVVRHVLALGELGVWFGFGNASVSRLDITQHGNGTRSTRLVYLNRHASDDARGLFG